MARADFSRPTRMAPRDGHKSRSNAPCHRIAQARAIAERSLKYRQSGLPRLCRSNFARATLRLKNGVAEYEAQRSRRRPAMLRSWSSIPNLRCPSTIAGGVALRPGGWDGYDLARPMIAEGIGRMSSAAAVMRR